MLLDKKRVDLQDISDFCKISRPISCQSDRLLKKVFGMFHMCATCAPHIWLL